MLAIINYGVGNLNSISKIFNDLDISNKIINDPFEAYNFDSFVLPGVGNFKSCINKLKELGWDSILNEEIIIKKKFILGICVGMQLFASEGYEGSNSTDKPVQSLNFIEGKVVNLKSIGCKKRLPHVGWNDVNFHSNEPLFKNIPNKVDFYFSHSYCFEAVEKNYVVGTSNYDSDFPVIIKKNNIIGVQFHPEKSSVAGRLILKNFIDLTNA